MEETKIINLFGIDMSFNVLVSLIVTVVIVFILCILMTRNLSVDKPSRPQVILESLIDFIKGIIHDTIEGSYQDAYIIISLALFLFLLVANFLGLPFIVHIHEQSYWKSPTADAVVALSLAVIMNLISHILGMRAQGVGKYWVNTYLKPNIVLMPVKIVEEVINIFTLALRLFGNIFAGEVLLNLISSVGNKFGLATWLVGIPLQMIWQAFSLFIGCIQAYIFVTLSLVYLSHKVEIPLPTSKKQKNKIQ
ncbi:F0F1 ATP synthase subunit A [Ignavigranum ruoffiae]|uniref:ATP synthase subunit a n=1 Tax=Ignavigranum ruoffiae TaxID=89093 RepID=A0A1H9AM10_9LACT|nr:F0F1 ATP synthase subunit A [Ignavigranum ruoffiae]UPQ85763.1 F0F1 ATP synthase subunit A [Ignavigranum ruoffiae]SEP77750.1 F-type H+-transporting ATPase subunit a [Ignavigranum ruoffiae]